MDAREEVLREAIDLIDEGNFGSSGRQRALESGSLIGRDALDERPGSGEELVR